ncbi:hypothetical protein [Nonomuraea sp. NPDC005650]
MVPVLVARSEGRIDEAVLNAPPQPLDESPASGPRPSGEPAIA